MNRQNMTRVAMTVAIGIGLFSTSAFGQVIINGGTAADNVGGAGSRAPGQMSVRGIARAQQAADDARAPLQITATAPTGTRPIPLFLSMSLQGLLDELNNLLAFFGNRLFERAGFPPLFELDTGSVMNPDDTTPPEDDSSTTPPRGSIRGRGR